MRHLIIIFLLLFSIGGCGDGIKIGLDEETLDYLDGDDDEDEEEEEEEDEEDLNYESSDTSGGVQVVDDYSPASDRYFMGTYIKLSSSNFYYDGNKYKKCDYDFPKNIRAYSHDNAIDFENSLAGLLWVAEIFDDNTFDFEVIFKDEFGFPSLSTVCVCYLEPPYYSYQDEQIRCSCEVGDVDECFVSWEKIVGDN